MSSLTEISSARRLEDKVAVIFGAGGEVGGAVEGDGGARRPGLPLWSDEDPVQELAQAISNRGGTAAAAEVDALDEDAVISHLDDVVAAAGRIDILFNAMGPAAAQEPPGAGS